MYRGKLTLGLQVEFMAEYLAMSVTLKIYNAYNAVQSSSVSFISYVTTTDNGRTGNHMCVKFILKEN